MDMDIWMDWGLNDFDDKFWSNGIIYLTILKTFYKITKTKNNNTSSIKRKICINHEDFCAKFEVQLLKGRV